MAISGHLSEANHISYNAHLSSYQLKGCSDILSGAPSQFRSAFNLSRYYMLFEGQVKVWYLKIRV